MIRLVKACDWERLREARLRALATDPYAFVETLEEAERFLEPDWRRRATPTETRAAFVEERDGSFAAMVAAFVDEDQTTVYLVGMWVSPELRRTGIAVELVEQVLSWARQNGRTRVLLSVAAGNDRAARLYTKCGFVEIPRPAGFPYEPNADERFYEYEM